MTYVSLQGKSDAAKVEQLQRMMTKAEESIKELKGQLKKREAELKERSLLLDMYKTCTKETRDKVQLMAAEKKARGDLEDCRKEIKKMGETNKEAVKKLADEDATRRIKQLEDQVETLRKQAANNKQEEDTLITDMEVTGQALEEMQEQNSRLLQQLQEKDEANFKLMSERIKSNQIARLAREEKEMYIQQVATLTTQVEAQNQVVRKLEEKERLLQTNLATVEKELQLRQQAMEMHKRKAIESAQSAADLKLHLEKYHSQIKEVGY
jgi:E3 ubiquitin-protein ligase BRE1